jgi:hypothetical protein
MLKQGGEFKIQGKQFKTIPPKQILTSKGEKDGGVITIPGLDSRILIMQIKVSIPRRIFR